MRIKMNTVYWSGQLKTIVQSTHNQIGVLGTDSPSHPQTPSGNFSLGRVIYKARSEVESIKVSFLCC